MLGNKAVGLSIGGLPPRMRTNPVMSPLAVEAVPKVPPPCPDASSAVTGPVAPTASAAPRAGYGNSAGGKEAWSALHPGAMARHGYRVCSHGMPPGLAAPQLP
ncbi:UNVERIFIED_CONTAM: hypothetical protein K2H54_030850 [Gekko kuhli]